jgi:polyribonucleotide nucleotidyltransferase
VRDVLRLGQVLEVKVISIDEENKVRVSRKAMEQPAGPPAEGEKADRPRGYHDRDRRPRNRS